MASYAENRMMAVADLTLRFQFDGVYIYRFTLGKYPIIGIGRGGKPSDSINGRLANTHNNCSVVIL